MKPLSINESVARAKKRWQREQLFFILGLIILLVVGSELTNHWMTDASRKIEALGNNPQQLFLLGIILTFSMVFYFMHCAIFIEEDWEKMDSLR